MSDIGEIKNATAMKILGGLLIFFSVVEFGVGGAAYGFVTNVHLGAWWGAICCFIAGICGVISNGRPAVITGLVFSIFAVIVAIVGAVVDGLATGIIFAEEGCTNTDTTEFWGSGDGKVHASYCAYGDGWFFYTYGFYNSYYYNHYPSNNFYFYSSGLTNQCICANKNLCYGYELASGDDCGTILTTYPGLLSASTAFLSLLVVLSFVYSIYTCIACSGSSTSAVPAAAPTPMVVQMAPNSGAAPVYVQPAQQPYATVPVISGYVPQTQPVAYTAVETTEGQKEAI